MVKDIIKGGGHSNASFLTAFGNHVYFAANDAKHGYELWRTDGTNAGSDLLIDIYPGKKSSAPQDITVSGGVLYFTARTETEGEEIWKSDGTAAGTEMLKDVNPGPASSFPRYLVDADSKFYFAANDGTHGVEFWKSDGTTAGTELIMDSKPGRYNGTSWIMGLAGHNGFLYSVRGRNLFVSDGTEEGTTVIGELGDHYTALNFHKYQDALYVVNVTYSYDNTSYDVTLVKVQGTTMTDVALLGSGYYYTFPITGTSHMYFMAQNTLGDQLIWQSDGTEEGTVPFLNHETYTAGANPDNFVLFNDKLHFTTYALEAETGLWSTDGTEAGTEQITSGNIWNLVAGENVLYFDKDGALWKSDGTVAGTALVSSLNPGIIETIGDVAYFNASGGGLGLELWRSDGTAEGTFLVKDINPGILNSDPNGLINVNGTLFFSARTSVGEELWKSDGTTAGTVMVKDIIPGSTSSDPRFLTNFNNQLYFVATRASGGGGALYRSDGTAAGTVAIESFESQPFSEFRSLTISGGRLYFTVRDGSNSESLYHTDGTLGGTTLIRTFPSTLSVTVLTEYHGKTYVLVSAMPSSATTLWATDGTAAGTSMVAELEDFTGGPSSVVLNDVLYFEGGNWLGRTDGTACGTFFIQNSGDMNVLYPGSLVKLDDKLLFYAYADEVGVELFRLDASAAPTSDCEPLAETLRVADAVSALDEEDNAKGTFIAYPNPFTSEFQLTFDKTQGDRFDVVIYSIDGQVIARYDGLSANEKHALGEKLQRGLYFIRINSNGKRETRRLVKR